MDNGNGFEEYKRLFVDKFDQIGQRLEKLEDKMELVRLDVNSLKGKAVLAGAFMALIVSLIVTLGKTLLIRVF